MFLDLERLESDIVQLQHEAAGFGTGRLIADNLILTAAHTLDADDGTGPVQGLWQARLERDRGGGPWHFRRCNRVVWCDQERDLALIKVDESGHDLLRPALRLRVATVSRANRHSVEARGYPRASKQAEGRELTPAHGVLTAAGRDRPLRFGVDRCDLPNEPHADWPGMSGSSVLLEDAPAEDEIWIYGVVQSVPVNFDGQLRVARLDDAWQKDATFRALLVAAGAPDVDAEDPTVVAPFVIPGRNPVSIYPERIGQAARPPSSNPYKGLLYFDEKDADRFFGRENLINDLYARLTKLLEVEGNQPRLLPVYGPSGSGKSSLLRAGLIPRLAREQSAKLVEPRVLLLTPGPYPLEALARALARFATEDIAPVAKTDEFAEVLSGGCTDGLRRIVDALPTLKEPKLILVIDQFEELYIAPAAPKEAEIFEAERDRFIATLLDATNEHRGRILALVAMRSDFLDETQRHPELNAQIARSGFLVPTMSQEELESAIRKPAARAQPPYEFQKAFVELLVNEALGQPSALPLLQFALQRVWSALPVDPAATLNNLGGIGGVVAVEAEKMFCNLSVSDQAIARRACLARVNIGEGSEYTRRRAKLSEITTEPISAERELSVLRRFARPEARLITLNQEPGDTVTFEVAHETLIRRWDRLRRWLDEGRDDQRLLHRALEAAALWEHGEGILYRDFPLKQLEEFAEREEIPARLAGFLEASVAASTAEEQRQKRHRRTVWLWAIAATALFLAAAVMSKYLAHELFIVRETTFRLLVEQAERAVQEKDYLLALETAIRAWDMRPEPESGYSQRAYQVVRETLSANQRLIQILQHDGPVRAVAFHPKGRLLVTGLEDKTARLWDISTGEPLGKPMEHGGPVNAVAFDPRGELVVTGSDDATGHLWNAHTGDPVGKPMKHGGRVNAVAFDPRGELFATASQDETARLWDAHTGEPVGTPLKHEGPVTAIAFDSKGELIITGSEDSYARLWDAHTGARVGRMKHDGPILAVAFDSEGKLAATGSMDKTARLWDARTGETIGVPMRHDAPVFAVAFDPKGRLVVTGSGDKAQLWDIKTGESVGRTKGYDRGVRIATFDPKGEIVLTGGLDKTAKLWSADTGELVARPLQHGGRVTAVDFDPNGEIIATGSADKTTRLWQLHTNEPIEKPLKHNDSVLAIAFDPTGRLIVTGSEDTTARLWSTRSGEPVGVPMQQHGAILAVAFDAEGKLVVTGSLDRTARLWDAHTGEPVGQAMQHNGPIRAVAFDPDDKFVITGSDDKTARLWDAHTGTPIGKPLRHDGPVVAMAVAPQGGIVATGSQDYTARLWIARTGEPMGQPMRHLDAITTIAFNPAGTLVATGAAWKDKTARLWDARSGEPMGDPMRHGADVLSLAFDPKGELLVTGSEDNTARLWNAHTGEPVGKIMQHGGPVWAVAFDPKGVLLATGSADGTAQLWNARTGEPIGKAMQHGGAVWAVAFDPKSALLATGSLDNNARLWLALSAEALFDKGRKILGPRAESGIASSPFDFFNWIKQKIYDAVERVGPS